MARLLVTASNLGRLLSAVSARINRNCPSNEGRAGDNTYDVEADSCCVSANGLSR